MSDPTNKLKIPREIMICLAEVSLAETARMGHYGLYFDTRMAEDPELVKTMMSFAFIS
jgi:hypothetical protein